MQKGLTRRNFLTGAATSAVALAAVATPALADESVSDSEAITYADTIAWDGEYDVIVIGFGLAGGTAAYFAAKEGANVLLIDKAPEGNEGGNSRYAGQCIVHSDSYEDLESYYTAIFAGYDIPEESFNAYINNAYTVLDMVQDEMGFDVYSMKELGVAGDYTPEYPEYPGSDTIDMYMVSPVSGDGALWKGVKSLVTGSDLIDVWYGCPGKHLIQDPESKTIIGAQIERDGELVNIRANNGVVLSTGGYENNKQMLQDYLDIIRWSLGGTTYNTGDGVHMAQEVGADLWHMNTWEGRGQYFGGMSFPVPDGDRGIMITSTTFVLGSIMLVGGSGTRYLREDEKARHGHIYTHGVWRNPSYPKTSYAVFDQKKYERILEEEDMAQEFLDQIISADTIAELCEKTGMVESELTTQIDNFNYFVETGDDRQFGRSVDTMEAFAETGPYYALELIIGVLNTQGGPTRNPEAEILDPDGNAIPHLYSAGELGGTICVQYQGGGNIMECLTYGRTAGINAAAPKDPLPALKTTEAESTMTYTIDSDYDRGGANWEDISLADNEYRAVAEGMGGDVVVVVAFNEIDSGDGKSNYGDIVDVEVIYHNETEGIGTLAIDELPAKFVEANSADVDIVSGATITSNALIEAVADCIAQHDAATK